MLKKYLINIGFMTSLSTDERWMLSVLVSISPDGIVYPGEDTLIEWSGWGDQKVKKVRKSLEIKGFLLIKQTQPNGKKIYQISESKIIESVVKKENTGVKITPHRGENHTATGVKNTPLNNIYKYNILNKGKNNKSEEQHQISSPAFIPVEQVRDGSKADLNFDKKAQVKNMNDCFKELSALLPGLKGAH